MQLRVLVIGKPKLDFAKAGIEEYASRLKGFGGMQIEHLKASRRDDESIALLARSEGLYRVALDERGEHLSSRVLAEKLAGWEMGRHKGVAFLIGGADGHTPELRARADWIWSLSRLTLQHELALVVLLEQVYRAYTIKAGLPYHRE